MVEVGNLQIGGSINTAEIERGMRRIEGGFKEISTQGKSVEADFERISARGKSVVAVLSGMAIAGSSAIIGLAKGAPAVAGSMAKIKVSMGELTRALGVALKPTFEWFADKFKWLADFVEGHPDIVGKVTTSMLAFGVALAGIKIIQFITGVNLLTTAFGTLAGVLGLPVWAVALGTLTAIASAYLNIKKYFSDIKELKETGTTMEKISYAATTGPLGTIKSPLDFGGLFDVLNAWFRRRSRQQSELEDRV